MIHLLLLGMMASANMRVLMIDAGSPNVAHTSSNKVGINKSIDETKDTRHYHSDAMFQFITSSACTNYRVDWCNVFDTKGFNIDAYHHCLTIAKTYDIVNLSITGRSGLEFERKLILSNKKATIVASAGNEGDSKLMYPAMYAYSSNRVRAISAVDLNGNRPNYSNYDKKAIAILGQGRYKNVMGGYEVMKGTSVATAYYTSKILTYKCNN